MKKKIKLITTTAIAAALIASCEPVEKTPTNTTGSYPAQTDVTENVNENTENCEVPQNQDENNLEVIELAGDIPTTEIGEVPEPVNADGFVTVDK